MSVFCPECHTENPDSAVRCSMCDALLHEDNIKDEKVTSGDSVTTVSWRIRCPVDGRIIEVGGPDEKCTTCPHENDDLVEFDNNDCKPVRVEIKTTIPAESEINKPLLALEMIDCEIDYDLIAYATGEKYQRISPPIIIYESGIIGRTKGTIESAVFSKDEHVSEEHCRIILEQDVWYAENLSDSTPTSVNQRRLSKRIKTKLHDGDLLQIADMLFLLSIRGCAEETDFKLPRKELSSEQNQPEKEARDEVWVITCPCCGRNYTVDSAEARITECQYCDEWDKTEIAFVRAVRKYVN